MPDQDASKLRRTNWDVIFAGESLGLLGDIDPNVDLMLDAVRTGTTGEMDLGDRFTGMKGTIKVQVLQTKQYVDLAKLLAPHYAGTGSVPLHPTAANVDLYDYAELLTLHPHDLPATNTTEDVNFVKSAMVSLPVFKRDGKKDDVWALEFKPYPDRDQLAQGRLLWACIGPVDQVAFEAAAAPEA